jgi:hypothetical protein
MVKNEKRKKKKPFRSPNASNNQICGVKHFSCGEGGDRCLEITGTNVGYLAQLIRCDELELQCYHVSTLIFLSSINWLRSWQWDS